MWQARQAGASNLEETDEKCAGSGPRGKGEFKGSLGNSMDPDSRQRDSIPDTARKVVALEAYNPGRFSSMQNQAPPGGIFFSMSFAVCTGKWCYSVGANRPGIHVLCSTHCRKVVSRKAKIEK